MAHGVEIEVEDSEDIRQHQNKSRCMEDGQLLNKRMKDKKQLARHHPSDLLHSLTHEQIGGGQHGVVSPVLPSFAISCAPHEAPDAHAYT